MQAINGKVKTTVGWEIFLDYYFWMQRAVDLQIGRVMDALVASQFNANTVVVFTSDHGEYGGSHNLQSKTGAVYDEAIHIPLYVSFGSQRTDYQSPSTPIYRDFFCSNVDVFPFLYTLARGNEHWRYISSNPYYYLRGRESLRDAIFLGGSATQRRTVTVKVPCIPPPGESCSLILVEEILPYVLHTMDEFREAYILSSDTNPVAIAVPPHILAIRTPKGKFAAYSFWAPCTIQPETSPSADRQPQYEFYDYNGGDFRELGNAALSGFNPATKVSTLTELAESYRVALNSVTPTEFEIYPQINTAHQIAKATYLGSGCP